MATLHFVEIKRHSDLGTIPTVNDDYTDTSTGVVEDGIDTILTDNPTWSLIFATDQIVLAAPHDGVRATQRSITRVYTLYLSEP